VAIGGRDRPNQIRGDTAALLPNSDTGPAVVVATSGGFLSCWIAALAVAWLVPPGRVNPREIGAVHWLLQRHTWAGILLPCGLSCWHVHILCLASHVITAAAIAGCVTASLPEMYAAHRGAIAVLPLPFLRLMHLPVNHCTEQGNARRLIATAVLVVWTVAVALVAWHYAEYNRHDFSSTLGWALLFDVFCVQLVLVGVWLRTSQCRGQALYRVHAIINGSTDYNEVPGASNSVSVTVASSPPTPRHAADSLGAMTSTGLARKYMPSRTPCQHG
jgi:hypothetical protein